MGLVIMKVAQQEMNSGNIKRICYRVRPIPNSLEIEVELQLQWSRITFLNKHNIQKDSRG